MSATPRAEDSEVIDPNEPEPVWHPPTHEAAVDEAERLRCAGAELMNVNCLKCGKPMRLLREAVSNYAWRCPDQCLPPVDTGDPVTEQIAEFEKEVWRDKTVDMAR